MSVISFFRALLKADVLEEQYQGRLASRIIKELIFNDLPRPFEKPNEPNHTEAQTAAILGALLIFKLNNNITLILNNGSIWPLLEALRLLKRISIKSPAK